MKYLLIILISMSACKKLPASQTIQSDTTVVENFKIISAHGFNLKVGDSLVTPSATFTKISTGKILQKAKVQHVKTKEITSHAVPVKIKDKSVNKPTININSNNKDKSTTKDKSNTGSKNKTNSFPWYVWVLLLGGIVFFLDKRFNIFR